MNKIRDVPDKIYSTSQYIDIETGEIITKEKFKRDYIKLETTKKYNFEEYRIKNEVKRRLIIQHTTTCRRNPQFRIFE